MNKLLTVIVSAGIGGAIGYFLGSKKAHYDSEGVFEENADQDMDEVYEDVYEILSSPYDPPEEKPNVEDLAAKYRTDDQHPMEDEPEEPYVITYDEFSEIGTNYKELVYYDEDDILTDEDSNVLDIPSVVGNCLSEFGVGTDDNDIVYVKNPKTGEYFEVTRLYESYYPV